jgi:hypothetical protein
MADHSHSNVVVLHNAHKDPKMGDYYPLYIPGVGTRFPEIGEMHESAEGKSQAKGGEARIHYAMIQIYNAVHRAVYGSNILLVPGKEALDAVRSDRYAEDNLNVAWTIGKGKRPAYFKALEARLKAAILDKKPEVKLINISVFGFSRGAAQARTFSNWMLECCKGAGDSYKFCDIPIRFQFLGIFDTVASVGLADSSPIGEGLMDWADGSMDIPKAIERTVHHVAAHEIRQNFPLSSGRNGKAYPANCIEIVYPGAHSDVGGGYGPNEQGKGAAGRAHLASQVPLIHMYQEAMKTGVPLMNVDELKHANLGYVVNDLQLHPTLAQRFQEYAKWSKVEAKKVESMLFEHMRMYWRWRIRVSPTFQSLDSYKAANEQDKGDMLASDQEFQSHLKTIDARELAAANDKVGGNYGGYGESSELERISREQQNNLNEAEEAAKKEKANIKDVPPLVHEFFDNHIHDSHASFRLREPLTQEEKSDTIKQVKEKQRNGKTLNPLEQRIIAQDQIKPGSFPVITDADLPDLKDMGGFITNRALGLIGATRRESGSVIRLRHVLDKS